MTKFADQLFDDLMREHGHALEDREEIEAGSGAGAVVRRRVTRPAWLTAGLVAATGAVAGGFVLFGSAAAPAYAVTLNQNGTVTVAVSQASAINAANMKLTALGVRVVVLPVRAGCPSLGLLTARIQPDSPQGLVSVDLRTHHGNLISVTVNAEGVPADETLVLAFDGTLNHMATVWGLMKGAVPNCISLPPLHAPTVVNPKSESRS